MLRPKSEAEESWPARRLWPRPKSEAAEGRAGPAAQGSGRPKVCRTGRPDAGLNSHTARPESGESSRLDGTCSRKAERASR
eukprot:5351028-Prymnesium_polylepis.1